MTTISATNTDGGILTAAISGEQVGCAEVIQDLVIPALIGIGFHPNTVWEAIADLGAEWVREREAELP